MEHETIVIIAGAVACIVAYLIGASLGRVRGSKAGLEAASAAEARAREQARAYAHDTTLLKGGQQRLVELIVNLPDTVNKMGSARSTSALCRITVRAVMDLVAARKVGLFIASGAPPAFRLEVIAGMPPPTSKAAFELGVGKLGRLADLFGVRTAADLEISGGEDSQSPADALFNPDLCISIRRHEKVYAFIAMDGVERDDAMTRRVVQMLADVHAVSAEGLSILRWDFLFYMILGMVVTSSVQIAGVLLVFTLLVVPSVMAIRIFDRPAAQFAYVLGIGTLAVILGAGLSYLQDLPTGATVVCIFGLLLGIQVIVQGLTGKSKCR